MSVAHVYHITKDGSVHKGSTPDCSRCSRKYHRPVEKAVRKAHSRVGGKKSARNRAATGVPPRTCTCGRKIARDNITGLCLRCLNEQRAKNKKTLPDKPRGTCATEGCKNLLSVKNSSGYCATCYRHSDMWRQHRENFNSWITTIVQGISANKKDG